MKKDKKNLINKKYLLTSVLFILVIHGQYAFSSDEKMADFEFAVPPIIFPMPLYSAVARAISPLSGEDLWSYLSKIRHQAIKNITLKKKVAKKPPINPEDETIRKIVDSWIFVLTSDVENLKKYALSKKITFINDYEVAIARSAIVDRRKVLEALRRVFTYKKDEDLNKIIDTAMS